MAFRDGQGRWNSSVSLHVHAYPPGPLRDYRTMIAMPEMPDREIIVVHFQYAGDIDN
jgi:hypothetical protein